MNSPLSFVAVSQSRFAQQSRKLIRLAGCTALCASGQLAFSETAGAQTPAPPASTFKVTPHSPTAAALGKYVDMPVTLATGTPQISVPLYEIKSGELSLPISLSYQATGFRVTERAGWVGMGWSLNAGGVISRSIRDKKDDGSFELKWGRYQHNTPDYVSNSADYTYLTQLMDSGTLPDGQPDLFTFSFPGHSGRFIRPSIGSMQLLPVQPLLIVPSGIDPDAAGAVNNAGADMARWTITDENGQQLTFGATELTERPHGRDVTSWFLTRLVSSSGRDTLEFEYSDRRDYTLPIAVSVTQDVSPQGFVTSTTNNSSIPFRIFTRSLTAVRFAEGRVEFHARPGRQDVPGEVQLDSLLVRDRQGRLTKRVWFGYAPAPTPTTRLQLDSVMEWSPGSQPAVHSFRYHATPLPPPNTLGGDHWGFHNGVGGLIPANPATLTFQLDGANRSADGRFGQAGLLTRITYPTGGYAAFAYEGHDYNGPRVFRTQYAELANVTANNLAAGGGSPLMPYADGVAPPGTRPVPRNMRPSEIVAFTLADTSTVTISASVNVTLASGSAHWGPISLREYNDETATGPPDPLAFVRLPEVYSLDASTTRPIRLFLGPGTYALKCMAEAEGSVSVIISCNLPTGAGQLPQAGGVRVRTITQHDGISHARDIIKRYRYRLASDSTKSSGLLTGTPRYVVDYLKAYRPARDDNTSGSFTGPDIPVPGRMYTASSQSDLGGGAHIFYQQVEESVQGPANGFSRYYYEGTGKGNGGSLYPYAPYDEVSRPAPLLLQRVDFNAAGDTVYRVQHAYGKVPGVGRISRGFSLLITPKSNFSLGRLPESVPEATRSIPLGQTIILSEFEYLAQTRESRYGTGPGQRPVVTTTRTYHENPQHLQPTRTVQVFAAQDSVVTLTRYPTDYVAPTTATDAPSRALVGLGTTHRLSTVVEQLRWRVRAGQPRLISASLQHFAAVPLWPARAGRQRVTRTAILPSRTYALRLAAPVALADFPSTTIANGTLVQSPAYEEVLRYERYDRLGNPLQVRRPGSLTGCFVWSDDGSELLAEVTNAPIGRVACTSFEPSGLGGWKYPQGADLAARRRAGGRTGRWAYALAEGYATGLDSLPQGQYRLTFWATGQPTVLLNGVPRPVLAIGTTVAQAPGGWVQYQAEMSVPALTRLLLMAEPGQAMLLDEVWLAPAGAQVTSYTYDPLVGMTSQTDATGRTLTYEYDAVGRLVRTRDEQGRLLSQQEYHYARP